MSRRYQGIQHYRRHGAELGTDKSYNHSMWLTLWKRSTRKSSFTYEDISVNHRYSLTSPPLTYFLGCKIGPRRTFPRQIVPRRHFPDGQFPETHFFYLFKSLFTVGIQKRPKLMNSNKKYIYNNSNNKLNTVVKLIYLQTKYS